MAFSTIFRSVSHTNPQFSSLLRMDDRQILHSKVDAFIHPQYLSEFYAALKSTNPCYGTRLVFLDSTGATRPLPTAIMRFKNAYLMRIFANKGDMTIDSEPTVDEVGKGIVHDMNNALGGAVGHLGLNRLEAEDLGKFLQALVEAHDDKSIAEVLRDLPKANTNLMAILRGFDAIESSLGHAGSILRGFGDFCSGKSVSDRDRHFEVPDAIRSAVAIGKGIVGSIAKEKDIMINLSYDGAEERVCAFGNSEELQRIIINLIKNAALEFTKPNNRIIVEWSCMENAANEKFIEIRVKDSGPPIPKDLAIRLFRERVDSTHGGTGIGLLTCAQIIHESGGEIRYQSIPDKCFAITLKAAGA